MSISVVMAAYNADRTIECAIKSALAQTLPPLEVIVVDDASTDSTRQVVRRIATEHSEVRLIELDRNGGPSRARNVGIAAARGEWFAITDSDDWWKAERLEVLWNLAQNEQADMVADNIVLFDAVENCEVRAAFQATWKFALISILDLFKSDILSESKFSYCVLQPMVKASSIRRFDILYSEELRYGEDFFFLAECLFNDLKFAVSREALYVYRMRIGEVSGKISPYSHSIPRFDLVVESSDSLAKKYSAKIDTVLASIIKRRRREKVLIHKANLARVVRRKKNYAKYVWMVASDWPLAVLLVQRTGTRLMRALSAAGRRRGPLTPGEPVNFI